MGNEGIQDEWMKDFLVQDMHRVSLRPTATLFGVFGPALSRVFGFEALRAPFING